MLLRICHTTRFEYQMPAYDSHNEVRMKPLDSVSQRCVEFELEITPGTSVVEYNDYYGNRVHGFSIHEPHPGLIVAAKSIVECMAGSQPPATPIPFGEFLLDDHTRGLIEYDFLSASRHVPFSEPMRKFFWLTKPDPSEDVAAYANRVVTFIRDQFIYEPGMTKVHSTADEILTVGGGVCQDFAHLTIGVLRLAGLPARYVSGYLAPAAKAGIETIGAQASHAWLEAQLPGQGWTGFDPTNGCLVDERHIRVAIGRDYSDVPPMRGTYRSHGSKQVMSVELQIDRQAESQSQSSGSSNNNSNQQDQQ
jgi:transglutaminase-like putative cysteine protease